MVLRIGYVLVPMVNCGKRSFVYATHAAESVPSVEVPDRRARYLFRARRAKQAMA